MPFAAHGGLLHTRTVAHNDMIHIVMVQHRPLAYLAQVVSLLLVGWRKLANLPLPLWSAALPAIGLAVQVGLATISAGVQRAGGSRAHPGSALDEALEVRAASIEGGASGDAIGMGIAASCPC